MELFMQQLVEFVGHHPYLSSAFVAVTVFLGWTFVSEGGGQQLQPQDATLLINHDNAIVLDVREDNEYKEGHIINAMHIPIGLLSQKIATLEKYRTRPIIANCASGSRSGQACTLLKKQGFEKVYNLKGGIMAWQNANLPLAKGTKHKKQ